MKKFSIALVVVLLIIFGGILVFDTSIKYEYGKENNYKDTNPLELIAQVDNQEDRIKLNENSKNVEVTNSNEKKKTTKKTTKKVAKATTKKTTVKKAAVKKATKKTTVKKTAVKMATKKVAKKTITKKTTVKKTTTKNTATTAAVSVVNYSLSALQSYAKDLVINRYGWTEADFAALVNLWNRESGWNPNSHNSKSGAHGIPQALPGNKMASEGSDWRTNGQTQIRWGLKYIAGRYGNPSNAWQHFLKKHWY